LRWSRAPHLCRPPPCRYGARTGSAPRSSRRRATEGRETRGQPERRGPDQFGPVVVARLTTRRRQVENRAFASRRGKARARQRSSRHDARRAVTGNGPVGVSAPLEQELPRSPSQVRGQHCCTLPQASASFTLLAATSRRRRESPTRAANIRAVLHHRMARL
jgi:hypothetical protein